jgi:hypothetical protein
MRFYLAEAEPVNILEKQFDMRGAIRKRVARRYMSERAYLIVFAHGAVSCNRFSVPCI